MTFAISPVSYQGSYAPRLANHQQAAISAPAAPYFGHLPPASCPPGQRQRGSGYIQYDARHEERNQGGFMSRVMGQFFGNGRSLGDAFLDFAAKAGVLVAMGTLVYKGFN